MQDSTEAWNRLMATLSPAERAEAERTGIYDSRSAERGVDLGFVPFSGICASCGIKLFKGPSGLVLCWDCVGAGLTNQVTTTACPACGGDGTCCCGDYCDGCCVVCEGTGRAEIDQCTPAALRAACTVPSVQPPARPLSDPLAPIPTGAPARTERPNPNSRSVWPFRPTAQSVSQGSQPDADTTRQQPRGLTMCADSTIGRDMGSVPRARLEPQDSGRADSIGENSCLVKTECESCATEPGTGGNSEGEPGAERVALRPLTFPEVCRSLGVDPRAKTDQEPMGELRRLERLWGPFEPLWLWLVAWLRSFGASTPAITHGFGGAVAKPMPMAHVGSFPVGVVTGDRLVGHPWVKPRVSCPPDSEALVRQGQLLIAKACGARGEMNALGVVSPWDLPSLSPLAIPELVEFMRGALQTQELVGPDGLDLDAVTNAFGPFDRLWELATRLELVCECGYLGRLQGEHGEHSTAGRHVDGHRLLWCARGLQQMPERFWCAIPEFARNAEYFSGPALLVVDGADEEARIVGTIQPWEHHLDDRRTADLCAALRTIIEDQQAEEG